MGKEKLLENIAFYCKCDFSQLGDLCELVGRASEVLWVRGYIYAKDAMLVAPIYDHGDREAAHGGLQVQKRSSSAMRRC